MKWSCSKNLGCKINYSQHVRNCLKYYVAFRYFAGVNVKPARLVQLVLCPIFVTLLFVSLSYSESLEVTPVNSFEIKKLELAEGQTADIIVYLKSVGEPVNNFLVTLKRDIDNKRVAAMLSDRYGRVSFEKVSLGRYRVDVNKKILEGGDVSTVSVGDILLSVHTDKKE